MQFFCLFFSVTSVTLLRPTAPKLPHVANAHFERDYSTYLSEAKLCGYYARSGVGVDDSDFCQWGTHCKLPEPSAEITGDMSKWDRAETRRVGQVVNTFQLHALHWFSAHVDVEFKCIYVICVKCFPGLHVTHREEGVVAGEITCGR